MDTKIYLLNLIKERNKKELIFKTIITNYNNIIKENIKIQKENSILSNEIRKSYECTGCQINTNLKIDNNYF